MSVVFLADRKGGPGSGNFGHEGRPGEVGGSSPGGNATAVAPTTVPAVINARVPAKMQQVEDSRLRGRSDETVIVLDSDGHWLGEWTDHASDYVNIPEDAKLVDGIFTHNHPHDTAFSPNDLGVAVRYNVAEMRAVTREGAFRLARIGSTWPPTVENVAAEAHARVFERLNESIAKGDISTGQASQQHWTEVWRAVAAKEPGVVFAFEKAP